MSRDYKKTALVLGLLCTLGIGMRSFRLPALNYYMAHQRYEDVYYVPPKQWLATFSLGHKMALCDLLWLRALVYFGEEIQHKGEVKYLFNYVDAMLRLDPYFRQAYLWVGNVALYRTGKITSKDAYKAADYLKKGVALFPDDGELAWDLGATLTYELPPLLDNDEEKNRAKADGIPYLETAARLGAGPSWLALSNASELKRLGQTEQALRHLVEIYATIQDPDTKENIKAQISSLSDQAYAEALQAAFAEFSRERQEQYPYLSPTLYLLVGERIDFETIDLEWYRKSRL
ncbi:MAG: hypothetical protein IPJ88_11800 [Myxococcales bacterium]|nr:MAG: hypothetical protein IPJ88_11800 [Myxococcales bacterium]